MHSHMCACPNAYDEHTRKHASFPYACVCMLVCVIRTRTFAYLLHHIIMRFVRACACLCLRMPIYASMYM